jgi:hypothetical protein
MASIPELLDGQPSAGASHAWPTYVLHHPGCSRKHTLVQPCFGLALPDQLTPVWRYDAVAEGGGNHSAMSHVSPKHMTTATQCPQILPYVAPALSAAVIRARHSLPPTGGTNVLSSALRRCDTPCRRPTLPPPTGGFPGLPLALRPACYEPWWCLPHWLAAG